MSYAIFRSKAINTVMSLSQLGKHNKREKEAYLSNPDIRKHNTFLNIQIVPCNTSYSKRFNEITKDYQDEHNKRMETMRSDRKCTFTEHVNSAKNVVADELDRLN